MEVSAKGKYVRRTPRKARLVADLVQGMRVGEALAALEFSPKHAALDVAKVIKSAAANAEHNFNLSRDELWVKLLLVDEGPTIKRIRPVSRGMAHQYFHRTCHITAVVEDRPEVEQARPVRPRSARRPSRGAPAAGEARSAAPAGVAKRDSRKKAKPEPEAPASAEAAPPEAESPPERPTPEAEAPQAEASGESKEKE